MEKDWQTSGFNIPKVLYAVNKKSGETYLVIEDDSTIFRFINKQGQIYVVAAFRCSKNSSPQFLNGTPFYTCDDILHPITCSKLENPKDKFVVERIQLYL